MLHQKVEFFFLAFLQDNYLVFWNNYCRNFGLLWTCCACVSRGTHLKAERGPLFFKCSAASHNVCWRCCFNLDLTLWTHTQVLPCILQKEALQNVFLLHINAWCKMSMSYMFFIMLAVEDLFSTDSFYQKFIRERNNTGNHAELKSGALREWGSLLIGVLVGDAVESHLAFLVYRLQCRQVSVSPLIMGKWGHWEEGQLVQV